MAHTTLNMSKLVNLPSQTHWYHNDGHDPNIQVAEEAFLAAKQTLIGAARSKKDKTRLDILDRIVTSGELFDLVTATSKKYEEKRGKSDFRYYLVAFSRRVISYSEVVDVFVSSHPEYAALVWGTLKFVFLAVVNYEEVAVTVLEGLVAIAGALPNCEVTATLYPTAAMKRGLSEIYADIIGFLAWAYDWFEAKRFSRAMRSIAKSRLQYGDVLDKISTATMHLQQLAETASHAEIRDIHIAQSGMLQTMPSQSQIQGLQSSLSSIAGIGTNASLSISTVESHVKANQASLVRIDQSISNVASRLRAHIQEGHTHILEKLLDANSQEYYTIQMGAHINTNTMLSDVQFSNIMSSLEQAQFERPEKLRNVLLILANRPQRIHGALVISGKQPVPVWKTTAFREWGSCIRRQSLITILASGSSRPSVRAFLAIAIDLARVSGVPVFWAVHGLASASDRSGISLIDIFKYLTHQALRYTVSNTEKPMSIISRRLMTAGDDDCTQWIKVLAHVLRQLDIVYIFVDSDVFSSSDSNRASDGGRPTSLTSLFMSFFEQMAATALDVVVKVLLTAYGLTFTEFKDEVQQSTRDLLTLKVGGPRVLASRSHLVSRGRGRGAMRVGMQRVMGMGK